MCIYSILTVSIYQISNDVCIPTSLVFFAQISTNIRCFSKKNFKICPFISAHTQRFHHLSETAAFRLGTFGFVSEPHLRSELRNGILDRSQSFLGSEAVSYHGGPMPNGWGLKNSYQRWMFRRNPEKNLTTWHSFCNKKTWVNHP